MKINNTEVFHTNWKLYIKNILLILLIVDLAIVYNSGFQIIPFVKLLGVNVLILVFFYLVYSKESVIFKKNIIIISKRNILNKSVSEYPIEQISYSYSYRSEVLSRGGSIPVISFYYKEKLVFKIIEGRDWSTSSMIDILTILKKYCQKIELR